MRDSLDPRDAPFRPPGTSSSPRGLIPVRFSGNPRKPLSGRGMWRGVPDLEHSTLCAAFGLDPARFHFDVSSAMRGVGAMQQGYGGGRSARRVGGFVFCGDDPEPWGKLQVCFEGEKFSDMDPGSVRDWSDLNRS